MSTLAIIFAFAALFLELKALEHNDSTPLAAFCSIGAWVCAGVTVVLLVLSL